MLHLIPVRPQSMFALRQQRILPSSTPNDERAPRREASSTSGFPETKLLPTEFMLRIIRLKRFKILQIVGATPRRRPGGGGARMFAFPDVQFVLIPTMSSHKYALHV